VVLLLVLHAICGEISRKIVYIHCGRSVTAVGGNISLYMIVRDYLYRETLCYLGITCRDVPVRVSVCLTVRPSVTSPYCIQTATDRITQTTLHDSPGLYFSDDKNVFEISLGFTHKGGAKQRWGRVKSANFDE